MDMREEFMDTIGGSPDIRGEFTDMTGEFTDMREECSRYWGSSQIL